MENSLLIKSKERLKGLDLDDLLGEVSVVDLAVFDNVPAELENWYGVASDAGIIAYFADESDAFRYRLDYINRIMND